MTILSNDSIVSLIPGSGKVFLDQGVVPIIAWATVVEWHNCPSCDDKYTVDCVAKMEITRIRPVAIIDAWPQVVSRDDYPEAEAHVQGDLA